MCQAQLLAFPYIFCLWASRLILGPWFVTLPLLLAKKLQDMSLSPVKSMFIDDDHG